MQAMMHAFRMPFGWWNRFWFAGVDARVVALMRISMGIIGLYTHLMIFPELDAVLGNNAELASTSHASDWTRYSIYNGLEGDALHQMHALAAVPFVLMILGLGGRVGTLGMVLVYMSLHHGNTWMLNAGDRLVRLSAFALLLTPNTRAYSVDALLARAVGWTRPAVVSMATHRMVQIQLAWMYVATGIAKFEGSHWHRGTAVYYAMNCEVFQRFPGTFDHTFFAAWPIYIPLVVGTFVTLWWELLFPAFMLWRPTRIAALALGVAIHGGIALFMLVASFSFASVWAYLAFLDDRWVGRHLDRLERRLGFARPAPPHPAAPAGEGAVGLPPPGGPAASPA